jgi:hypothetical protein
MKTPTLVIGTCLLTTLLSVNAGTVLAVDTTVAVPHQFVKGGKIKAAEMNDNFSALSDAINDIALTPGPQGLQGPTGATGLSIDDAGTYVGQVGLGELGNFSLLTGAGASTGAAAADAACASAFPGSHAELNMLTLWKTAVNSQLPDPTPAFAYWASTVTDIPVPSSFGTVPRTTDCSNWSDIASGSAGYVRPSISANSISVSISTQSCTANNMAVACFSSTP